ncbi:hypothetical protein XI06_06020 [Bradyrhizobium sp. CCBAU 11434]|nr:hypothetical protein [Bradyrhizobium sp. CCBAU 11434]
MTGTCSEVCVNIVFTCAGMSSGPSVSCVHGTLSGASRDSAVVRSTSTDGSAFSWTVSDAEVWRMNSVSAPSRALASLMNFVTSLVRSVKPRPGVCTASSDETIVVACTDDGAERVMDLADVMKGLSTRKLPWGG